MTDGVGLQFRKLMDSLELRRLGCGFYALRHTFKTEVSESRDQVAVDAIMGHIDDTIAAHYLERISDERLQAVTDHVPRWLYSE